MSTLIVGGAIVALATLPGRPEARSKTRAPSSTLRFQIVSAGGTQIPAKLTVIAVGRRGRAKLGGSLGTPVDGGVAALNRVFSTSGAGQLRLHPGEYDVVASRGLEWTLDRQRIRLDGSETFARFRIDRAIDTSGWLSADMHVHAERSTDSNTPMRARLEQLISDGVELVVSTDHNTVSDYQPAIADIGAHHLITSIRGDEITTKKWGHLVAFPLPVDVASLRRRAVLARASTGLGFTRLVRRLSPESIIIAAHPHSRSSSYLRDGGLDTRRDRARRGFSWDFDAIEIVNGYNKYSLGRAIERNLRTWFDLLDHGHLVTAVGSSDTHALRGLGGQGGYPRTFIAVPHDRPDRVGVRDIVRGIKAQRALVTTGPFVRARIGSAGVGDVAPAPAGRAVLEVEIQAAPWVSADRLTVYVNGEAQHRQAIPISRARQRLRAQVSLAVSRDSHVVVRVDGRGSLEPVIGERKHAIPSLAVTNPIYLDVDGNGRFDAPLPHGHPTVVD